MRALILVALLAGCTRPADPLGTGQQRVTLQGNATSATLGYQWSEVARWSGSFTRISGTIELTFGDATDRMIQWSVQREIGGAWPLSCGDVVPRDFGPLDPRPYVEPGCEIFDYHDPVAGQVETRYLRGDPAGYDTRCYGGSPFDCVPSEQPTPTATWAFFVRARCAVPAMGACVNAGDALTLTGAAIP